MKFVFIYTIYFTVICLYSCGIFLALKSKKIFLSILLIPVILFLGFKARNAVQMQIQSKEKKISISEMKLIDGINPEEVFKIAMNSSVLFGYGEEGGGGLIKQEDLSRSDIRKILDIEADSFDHTQAIIWLVDSTVSAAIQKNNLMILKSQKVAENGIWIGLVSGDDLERIEFIKKAYY